MKYLVALLLLLCSANVSAQSYGNEVWVNYGNYLLFYQSCWTVVDKIDYNGSYCYGEFTSTGLPYTNTSDSPQKQVIVFGMESDVPELIDRTSCYQTKEESVDDGQKNFYFDCGDIIFKNDFEKQASDGDDD